MADDDFGYTLGSCLGLDQETVHGIWQHYPRVHGDSAFVRTFPPSNPADHVRPLITHHHLFSLFSSAASCVETPDLRYKPPTTRTPTRPVTHWPTYALPPTNVPTTYTPVDELCTGSVGKPLTTPRAAAKPTFDDALDGKKYSTSEYGQPYDRAWRRPHDVSSCPPTIAHGHGTTPSDMPTFNTTLLVYSILSYDHVMGSDRSASRPAAHEGKKKTTGHHDFVTPLRRRTASMYHLAATRLALIENR